MVADCPGAMSALRTSLPPAPPPSASIAWVIEPLFIARIVCLPLFGPILAGVSLNWVSTTPIATAPGAGVAAVDAAEGAAELVDLLLELLLLLPQPAAATRSIGPRATTTNPPMHDPLRRSGPCLPGRYEGPI